MGLGIVKNKSIDFTHLSFTPQTHFPFLILTLLSGCHVDQPRNLAKSVTVE